MEIQNDKKRKRDEEEAAPTENIEIGMHYNIILGWGMICSISNLT